MRSRPLESCAGSPACSTLGESPKPTFARGAVRPVRASLATPSAAARLTRGLLILALAAGTLGISACGDNLPEDNRVVATVNGKKITHGDLIRQLEQSRGPAAVMKLLDQQLIEAEAARRKLTLSDAERDAGLERAAARVGSMKDLKAKLNQLGIPLEAYRQEIATDLLLDKIAQQEVKVSEEEIKQYYGEHQEEFTKGPRTRARMMMFRDQSSAEAVLTALKEPGADFAGLAQNLSEDDATRSAGGDMGYFEKNDYATAITEAAFALKPGQISGIVKAPDGWVILKAEDHKAAGVMPLEEVRDQILQRLKRDKLQPMRDEWLVQARDKASLRIRDRVLREAVRASLGYVKPAPMPGEL